MQDEGDSLATLTFNTSATREMFAEQAKGLKLRIERGVVTFRSAQRGGIDVVAIERRPRGIRVALDRSQLPKRLMQRLFRAGLTQEQPYFLIEPATRGWYGIQHYPFDHPPQRQAIMVVSEFDPPPVPVDLSLWHKFRRLLNAQRPVDPEHWQTIHRMVLSAARLVARPQRGGRVSAERQAAARLLSLVENNESLLMGWAKQEPDVAADVRDMLVQVIGRDPEEPDVVPTEDLQPEGSEDSPDDRPSRRGGRPRRPFPLASPADESPTEVEAEPTRPATRRRRRTWPPIPSLDAEPEDLPRPSFTMEQDEEPEPVASETGQDPEPEESDERPGEEQSGDNPPDPIGEREVETAPGAPETETVETETFVESEDTTEVDPEPVAALDDMPDPDALEEGEPPHDGAVEAAETGETEVEASETDGGEGEAEDKTVAAETTETPSEQESEPEREIDLSKVFANFVDQTRTAGDRPPTAEHEKKTDDEKPAGLGDQPEVD